MCFKGILAQHGEKPHQEDQQEIKITPFLFGKNRYDEGGKDPEKAQDAEAGKKAEVLVMSSQPPSVREFAHGSHVIIPVGFPQVPVPHSDKKILMDNRQGGLNI